MRKFESVYLWRLEALDDFLNDGRDVRLENLTVLPPDAEGDNPILVVKSYLVWNPGARAGQMPTPEY